MASSHADKALKLIVRHDNKHGNSPALDDAMLHIKRGNIKGAIKSIDTHDKSEGNTDTVDQARRHLQWHLGDK